MSETKLHWIAEFAIPAGNLATFTSISKDIITAVEATEPGTLAYEWYVSPDGKTCRVDEWYADTVAALAHLKGEAPRLLPKLLAFAEFKSLDVYCDIPDGELKELLNSFDAVFHRHNSGFSR